MFSHQKGSFYVLRGCPKSLKIAFADCPPSFGRGNGGRLASLHFAKVLIARRATTFAKVDYSDYQ